MKHARPDYDRIQDPAGLIPENEPVFLLRGSDPFAPAAVRRWALSAQECGADPVMVGMAFDHAELMVEWQQTTRCHFPDLPAEKQ